MAEGLGKRFGDLWALRDLDLDVPAGTVLGLLGHNGAGKTTAVRILTTLALPTTGTARVAGRDVVADAPGVRARIGLAAQSATVDGLLDARSNLELVGRLYHLPRATARERADELLERLGLSDAAGRLVKTFSGGMRRRLDLAATLVASPPVLFLDEPTTGLDPQSRNELWELLRELVGEGTTVLLTTQYLEEADRLADDIVIIDGGRAVATGSPDVLKDSIGVRVDVLVESPSELPAAAAALAAYTRGEPEIDDAALRISAPVAAAAVTVPGVVRMLDAAGVAVLDVGVRRPTLDEVFLHLVGRPSRQEEAAAGAPSP